MTSFDFKLPRLLGMLTLSLLLLSGSACKSSDEQTPPDGNGGTGGGGKGGGAAASGGKGGGGAGSGGEGGGTVLPDECADQPPPQANEEFLNQCTGSDCEPFDNEDRIQHTGYVPGAALEDLPDP